MKPTLHSFGILIIAWSCHNKNKRQNLQVGPEKAQKVLDDMWAHFDSGDKHLAPDVVHYMAVMGAWARAKRPERAERLVLRGMKERGVKPNRTCYGIVQQAWSQSKRADAKQRRQALIEEELRQAFSDDDEDDANKKKQ
jgi:pentatricopeptide repeat protein